MIPRHRGPSLFGGVPAVDEHHDDGAEKLHAEYKNERKDDRGKPAAGF
jgi:hypothetical protein